MLEKNIELFFKLRHFSKKQIENVKLNFLKQSFLNKFFDNKDVNNMNMAIIYRGKNIRMSPMYDFDYCMGNERVKGCNIENTVQGKSDILSFIDYYKNNKQFISWVKAYIMPLELKKADIKENNNNLHITSKTIDEYNEKINQKKMLIKEYLRNTVEQEDINI